MACDHDMGAPNSTYASSHMGDHRAGDAPCNRNIADLSVLTLPRNWASPSPAELQTILETWLSRMGMVVATWHASGTDLWREIHAQARQRHAAWCNAPIRQRVSLERPFSFGQQRRNAHAAQKALSLHEKMCRAEELLADGMLTRKACAALVEGRGCCRNGRSHR
eukprot:3204629-Amphidinium_carterae.2